MLLTQEEASTPSPKGTDSWVGSERGPPHLLPDPAKLRCRRHCSQPVHSLIPPRPMHTHVVLHPLPWCIPVRFPTPRPVHTHVGSRTPAIHRWRVAAGLGDSSISGLGVPQAFEIPILFYRPLWLLLSFFLFLFPWRLFHGLWITITHGRAAAGK